MNPLNVSSTPITAVSILSSCCFPFNPQKPPGLMSAPALMSAWRPCTDTRRNKSRRSEPELWTELSGGPLMFCYVSLTGAACCLITAWLMETAAETEINRRRGGDGKSPKSAEETARKQTSYSYLGTKVCVCGGGSPHIYPFKQHFGPIRVSDKLQSISRGSQRAWFTAALEGTKAAFRKPLATSTSEQRVGEQSADDAVDGVAVVPAGFLTTGFYFFSA